MFILSFKSVFSSLLIVVLLLCFMRLFVSRLSFPIFYFCLGLLLSSSLVWFVSSFLVVVGWSFAFFVVCVLFPVSFPHEWSLLLIVLAWDPAACIYLSRQEEGISTEFGCVLSRRYTVSYGIFRETHTLFTFRRERAGRTIMRKLFTLTPSSKK